MTQLRTSMVIDLAGNLSSRAGQFLGSMQRLGSGGARSMQMLARGVSAAGRGLDRLGNRYTAMLTGGGLALKAKEVGDLSERLTYLGIQSQAPKAAIDKLYASILRVAQAPDIRVDPSELLSGVETIVEKLGDMKLAEDNLRNIGYVIRATGAAGKDAGDMIANFKEKFDLQPEEMLPALDTLVLQGKAGAFTLKDMVTQGNRVTAAYGAMGRKGPQAIRELGAALQVFRKSSGSPEETSTAFKNFFNDLMVPANAKVLQENGIQIWDPEALKKNKKEIRSIVEITDQLLAKSKGDPEKLGRVLGIQTMDGFKAVINGYVTTGKNPMYDFLNVTGQGAELMSDSARAAQEFNAAVTNLNTAVKQFASTNLTKPIQQIADFLNGVGPDKTQTFLKNAKRVALALGGMVLARKAWNLYQGFGGRSGGVGGALGGLGGLGGKGGPIPVYVVNQTGMKLPGGPGGFAAGAGAAGSVGSMTGGVPKSPSALGAFGMPALPVIAALVARPLGKYLAREEASTSSTSRLQELLSRQIVMGGGPGSFQAKTIAEELQRRGAADVGGTIKLVIESDKSVRVLEMKPAHERVRFQVDSGLTMVAP